MPRVPDLPIPPELVQRLRDEPSRAPETIALAAGHVHGPRAAAWIAEQRSLYRHDNPTFAQAAKRKHATLARLGGAVTGVGGLITVLPDLVALAWIQSRLCFYVAAAYGFDPNDPMRPAELLVLRGIYDDPIAARAALDGEADHMALHVVDRTLANADGKDRDRAVAIRLGAFLGKRGAKRLAGRAIPGFAIALNATTNELETRRLADRAIDFYGGHGAAKGPLLLRRGKSE